MTDFDEAQRFLEYLDPHAKEWMFQIFDDQGGRFGKTLTGHLESRWPTIATMNESGLGVSVTVNTTDGNRKSENVQRVRAVWQDDDSGFDGSYPLPPSVVVQSSPGRYHRYWLVSDDWPADDQGREDFRWVMAGMVETYGNDPSAKDISRVMRLPGTVNRKGEGHLVKIVFPQPGEPVQRYSRGQIVEAFGVRASEDKAGAVPFEESVGDIERVKDAIGYISPDQHPEWRDIGFALHHATEGSLEGFAIWDEWSKGTARNNYDPRAQEQAWNSFRDDHSRPVTLATLFMKARENGWRDETKADLGTLPERPTLRFAKAAHNPNGLAERTIAAVRQRFDRYGHRPSEDQYEGLSQIAMCIEAMADSGTGNMVDHGRSAELAANYLVSFLPPGTGKTTVVIEAVRHLFAIPDYEDIGVIIFLSRLEEISKLVQEMGLEVDDFAVIVSEGKPENRLGRQDDKTKARILFTTQEGLRVRGKDGQKFADMERLFFRGKPRQVRIWDEAILPSKNLTVGQYDISGLFKTLRQWGHLQLADTLEDFFVELRRTPDRQVVNAPNIDGIAASIDEARSWFSDETDKDAIEALIKLSGQRVRVRKDPSRGEVMLDYEDILPEDLAPMLILDASGQLRETYWLWHESRKGLVFLPSPGKRYDGLTVHHWDRGAGKKAHNKDHLTLAEGVAKTINRDIPVNEPVLVVHFKPGRFIPDMEKAISGLIGGDRQVKFLTWGKHTATNEFHMAKHVILAGILQYSVPENEAVGRGAKALRIEDDLSETDFNGTRLGEIAHNIFQAACRGYVRKSHDGGCPEGCNLYIIFSTHRTSGVPRDILQRIFPGAEVRDWCPVYELKGQAKKLADAMATMTGEVGKTELMVAAGIKGKTSNLNRLLNDPHLKGYLTEAGIVYVNGRGVVTIKGNGAEVCTRNRLGARRFNKHTGLDEYGMPF